MIPDVDVDLELAPRSSGRHQQQRRRQVGGEHEQCNEVEICRWRVRVPDRIISLMRTWSPSRWRWAGLIPTGDDSDLQRLAAPYPNILVESLPPMMASAADE